MRQICLMAILIACSACGCSSTVTWPNWCHPGWIGEQRGRAERFDPYPAIDFDQSMYGTRPRDFMDPTSEVQQAQNQRSYVRRFGQLAPGIRR
jgi:hypothetical protein